MVYRQEESVTIANSYKSEPLEGRDPRATPEQVLNMKSLEAGWCELLLAMLCMDKHSVLWTGHIYVSILVFWVLLGLDHYVQVVKL